MSGYPFINSLSSKGLPVPELLLQFCEWISKIEYGTLGYFEMILEEVPKRWDPDNHIELQRSLLPFIHLPEGSMICLDITQKNCPVMLLGSEGGKSILASSFKEFLVNLAKGDTGVTDIDDVEDEDVADINRLLFREWLETKNIGLPSSKKESISDNLSISFDQLKAFFGKSMSYESLKELSSTFSGSRLGAEDDGSRYLVVKKLGFDLLFERTDQSGNGKSKDYSLNTIFLFNDAVDGHRAFPDCPYNINLSWNRSELLKNMPNPERTWKIGKGAVAVNCPDPDHDRWIFDEVTASVNYSEDLSIRMVVISIRDTK